jgi:hypothetical protein
VTTRPLSPRRAGAAAVLAAALALLLSACGSSGGGVNSCTSFTSPGTGDGAPFTLNGSVAYQDLTQNASGFTGGSTLQAVRQAAVQVVRCSDSAVLGSDTSAGNGAFSVTASNTGPLGVYVRVLAQVDSTNFDVTVRDQTAGALYALRSTAFDERSPPALNLSASSADIGAVFNILDQALIAVAYVDAAVALAAPLTPLTMVWEADTTNTTAFFPSPTAPKIEVLDQPGAAFPDTDGYDDMVILHELGHYLADQLSRDDSPGGTHSAGSTDQDARLSWSEGWGDFFSGAAAGNPDYVDTFAPVPAGGALQLNLEDSTASGGATSEAGVARALWDALDGAPGSPADSDADGAAVGPVPILEAFEDLQGGGGPVEFMYFWNAFRLANYVSAPADVAGFRTAAAGNGIDLVEDDGTDDVVGGATVLASPGASTPTTASANLDWDATAGSVPDTDHFLIPLTAGVAYTITTTALSDGADTFVTLLNAAGTTTLASNDNHDNVTYPNCDSTVTLACPVNGPYPLGSSPEPLSSRIAFTPSATASYLIRVTRSTVAPVSAGLFGGYDLKISR